MSTGWCSLDVLLGYRRSIGACLARIERGPSVMFNLGFWIRSGRIWIRRGPRAHRSRGGRGRRIGGRGAFCDTSHHSGRSTSRDELSRAIESQFKQVPTAKRSAPISPPRQSRLPSLLSRWCWAGEGSPFGLLIDQVVMRRKRRSISSLHAQPSHDTLYMTSSSAARGTSTQGLPPSVERRVEACQKSVLAARHWSPGVSWAVGRQCTVTCYHSRYLWITSSRPRWDEERC